MFSSQHVKKLSDRKGVAWAGIVGISMIVTLFLSGSIGWMFGVGAVVAILAGIPLLGQKAEYRDGKRFVDGVEDEDYKNRGVSPKQGRGPKE